MDLRTGAVASFFNEPGSVAMRVAIGSIVIGIVMTLVLGAAAQQPQPGAGGAGGAGGPGARSAGGTAEPGGGGVTRGGGMTGYSGGSGSDPLRFKGLATEGIREKLAPTDEQWKSLWPRIEKVLEAQRNARTGAAMAVSSRGMVRGSPPPGVGVGAPPAAGWEQGGARNFGGGSSGGSNGGSSGGSAGGGGSGVAMVDTPAGRVMQQIRGLLDQETASDAELIQQMSAMRVARDAARAEVAAAQKELKEACWPRAEAVLVTMGVLE